jgi:hypothetical protein
MFERMKRLWHEAAEAVKDDGVIRMQFNCQNVHETTPVDLSSQKIGDTGSPPMNTSPPLPTSTSDIDTRIAALVAEMNRVGIHTTCSCQGHDGGEAYVGIRLGEGTTYEYRKDIFGPGQDELTLRWIRK